MPIDSTPATTPLQAVAHKTLIANLRNMHAVEKQVIAVLEPQLNLIDAYPELHAKITQHIEETREQAQRLEKALESLGSSPSMVKDALLSVMGISQSSVQGFSDDAVLKAMIANIMTEHLEIASYRTLIVLAETAGRSDLCLSLERSLHEEETMADWFHQNLERLTRRFVELQAAEEAPVHADTNDNAARNVAPAPRATSDWIFDSTGAPIARRLTRGSLSDAVSERSDPADVPTPFFRGKP